MEDNLQDSTYTPKNSAGLLVIRLAFFLLYASQGVLFSFLVVYYYGKGMTGTEIGLINTVTPLVGMVTGVFWSYLNDKLGKTRFLIFVAILGSILSALGIGAVRPFGLILLLSSTLNFFYRPMVPLLDSSALVILGNDQGNQYGSIRLFGALGYSLAAMAAGYLLTITSIEWLFPSFSLVMLLMAIPIFFLPEQSSPSEQSSFKDFSSFLKNPVWVMFLASMTFLWLLEVGLFTFLPIHLKQLGGSDSVIGTMNAVQALAEAAFLFFSPRLLRRFKLEHLLLASIFIYALRILLYSLIPTAEWAIPLGLLHSLSFGLYIVCVIVFVERISPEGLKTTGQGLFNAAMLLVHAVGSALHGRLIDLKGAVWILQMDFVLGLIAALLFWFFFVRQNRLDPNKSFEES